MDSIRCSIIKQSEIKTSYVLDMSTLPFPVKLLQCSLSW